MRKSILILLFLSASLSFFFQLKKEKTINLSAQPEVKLIVSTLDYGERSYAKGWSSACQSFKGHHSLFCLEGYFRAAFKDFFKVDEIENAASLQKILVKLEIDQAPLSLIASMGGGIAFADEYGLEKIETFHKKFSLSKKLYMKYFVDGWAISASLKHYPGVVADICSKKLTADFRKVCLWGVGRSLFYQKFKKRVKGLSKEESKLVLQGFKFAKLFTKPTEQVLQSPSEKLKKEALVAQNLARLYLGIKSLGQKQKEIEVCLQRYHPAECI